MSLLLLALIRCLPMTMTVFLIFLPLTMSLASIFIDIHLSGLLQTNDIFVDDDDLVDDPSLDVDDSQLARLPQGYCTSPMSPINQFLFGAAVVTPRSVGDIQVLQHLLNTNGKLHECTVNAVRHHDYTSMLSAPRAHLDDGAQATTMHKKSHLFVHPTFPVDASCRMRLISADGHRYVPIGYYDILCVPAPNSLGYIPVFCLHAPEISSCIISPSSIKHLLEKKPLHHGTTLRKYPAADTFTFTAHSALRTSKNVAVHCILDAGLSCFTQPLLLPQQSDRDAPVPTPSDASLELDHSTATIETEFHLHKLSVRADQLLWHQRLAHCSDNYLYHAHKRMSSASLHSSTRILCSITVLPVSLPR